MSEDTGWSGHIRKELFQLKGRKLVWDTSIVISDIEVDTKEWGEPGSNSTSVKLRRDES